MKRNAKKFYSTGEFAKYFGIKKDTLLYYDKIGLFSPSATDDKGYRYYSSEQIDSFWLLLSMRQLNVPIKTLEEYFHDPTPGKLLNISEEQLKKAELEIQHLQNIHRMLSLLHQHTFEGIHAVRNHVFTEHCIEKYYLTSEKTSAYKDTSNEEWTDIRDEFILSTKIEGGTHIGSIISYEDLIHKRYGRVDCLFSETDSIKNASYIRKPGTYAVYYHVGNYDSIINAYPQLTAKLHAMNFEICGDAFEEYLIAQLATNNENTHITKITIPIQQPPQF